MRNHRLRRYLPSRASIRAARWIAPFAGLLDHPGLWHLNRRSVAGGVAVGLFAGLIPGPVQMLGAALIALPLRVNLPVAVATTWYTNPITIGPLYFAAYEIGKRVLGVEGMVDPAPQFDIAAFWAWCQAFLRWMLGLGKPLVIGLVVLAGSLALLGWLGVWFGWRWYVVAAWRRRGRRRASA
jgi:uncharacterized protein (DUF2062 family)